jgi:hypothetical protein
MTTFEFEREHYRVVYPAGAGPTFVGNGMERDVIDLCESGLRYWAAAGETRSVGDEVDGTVRLRRGGELRVLGTVVRVAGRDVALKLLAGVPLRVVLDEQRYLRDRQRGSAR